jgi:hypothetical protein
MTPQEFIHKWGPGGSAYELNEKSGAQQHFIELCALLNVPTPDGSEGYRFERDTLILGEKRGYADVFKRGAFAWEYKAPGKSLEGALRQLMMYALALSNPPLLIVSDRLSIEIHTHFNGTPSEKHTITLAQLSDPAKRELLRRAFIEPESLRPKRTTRQITQAVANAFASTAERLRARGEDADRAAHFLTQCLFCFFAEDVGLLPARLFERLVGSQVQPDKLQRGLQSLFETMRDGGLFGADDIPWFNGGLFKTVHVLQLNVMDVAALRTAANENWSAIDVSIFGTLFERGLDPKKRSQLGAHYTDPATIMRLVEPVVQRPLLAEWESVKVAIAEAIVKSKKYGDAAYRKAEATQIAFLEKLREFRVLDPACGSGNFLYLALRALKDLEHQVNIEGETLGLQRQVESYTSPANVLGIEINEYAAELARVTVWIGELQWRLQHGYPFKTNPVLEPLDHIEQRDALLTPSPLAGEGGGEGAARQAHYVEAAWPKASVVSDRQSALPRRQQKAR